MIVDKPLAELEQYRPPLTAESDFDSFWQQTLAESARQPLEATSEAYPYPVERVTVYKVYYNGFGTGTRVSGWYIVPKDAYKNAQGQTPTLVQYHGYSGGKGVPAIYLAWALQGYNVFTIDTRGQDGETPDNNQYSTGHAVGYMTKGILNPLSYYYRYVYMDCVRAIDFIRSQPEVGPIIIMGGSQGGGLTLATAALAKDRGIVAAMPDVPYLCHFQRAIEIFGDGPYHELVNYWKRHPRLVEECYRTLSYFDGLNFAPRITMPVLISVGLLDTVCPPSTGFAVYNHLAGEKEMRVYPFNAHEGGGIEHDEEKYHFVRKYFAKH